MTNSRIASALLAPALAAILAVACSSSDNNGGGATVGGNGGASSSKGGGPSVVTGDAACQDALAKSKKCTGTTDSSKDGEFLDACKGFTSKCTACLIDAECDKQIDCLTGEACAPDTGNGGASSGKGGSGGGGGTSSGKGGTGGSGTVDPEECLANCDSDNPDGADALNTFFVDKCGCAAGAACEAECGASCAAKSVDQACGTCLNALGQGDACVDDVLTACQADSACATTVSCYAGCQGGGGGSGGSGGGSGGQACAQECAKNNQAGVPAYNEDAKNLTKCLCEGDACKDKCGASPICTSGKPEGTQECISCQDACFPTCQADADCKKLYDCIQGCN